MNLLLNFSYDGTNFYGYQKQPNKRTVQGEIEKVLSTLFQEEVKIYASGRTDAKVHAINQYANFKIEHLKFDIEDLCYRMNKLLPNDIVIKKISIVDDNFHARFNAKYKVYEMLINFKEKNPFYRNYVVDSFSNVSIKKCKEIAKYFIGKKNFMNYCSKEEDENNFIRTIYDFKILVRNGKYIFKITGNGFMKYMVRKIIGVLIEIGKGKLTKEFIKENLDVTSRNIVTYTAEPQGLYLFKIYY